MAVIHSVSSQGIALPAGILAICFLSFIILNNWARSHKGSRLPLPPGPPAEPLLGHLRIVPAELPELAYMQWSKEYNSDILSFRIINQSVVVLNSVKAADELLNRRGANYSDRPPLPLLNDAMGFSEVGAMAFMPWGSTWRKHRRMIQQYLLKSPTRLPHYHKRHLERELALLLRRYTDNPNASAREGLHKFSVSVMLGTTYGLRIWTDDDPFVQTIINLRESVDKMGSIGGTPTDFIPILRFLPNWLVDKTLWHARDGKKHVLASWSAPYEAHKASEEKTPCMLRDALEDMNNQLSRGLKPDMNEEEINGMVGVVNLAGQDTTWSSFITWTFNMVMHPEIQAKAQKALDEVVGRDRLPTFEDRPKLPYINCLVQETLRWSSALPFGIAHRSIKDDEYNGYLIPGGSVILANAYAMTHDEKVYQNPDTFEPERYLPVESGGRAEPHPVGPFGFGRRICPGRLVAESTMWITIASLLSTMKIEKKIDDEGNPITPTMEFAGGLVMHMKDFPCTISPRDQKSIDVIQRLQIEEAD